MDPEAGAIRTESDVVHRTESDVVHRTESDVVHRTESDVVHRTVFDTARVALTPAAADLLVRLTAIHGPLMFHQSGGCCDGSAPMCYPDGEFLTGDADVHLGDLVVDGLEKPIGFWMSVSQYEYWKHTHLTVDVVKGRGSGFSVEAPEGVRFLIRSRLFTDEEWLRLED